MIYQVAEQLIPYRGGRPYGCSGFRVSERRSLRLAISDADACAGRAVVTTRDCADVLHDNGKEPARGEYDPRTNRAVGVNVV
jgi:hypothetical protein